MRKSRTRSLWSPCSMICPSLWVPPHAQNALSLCAISDKSVVFSSMPSMTVVGRPNFRVSRRIRILCCSFSISPQTHKSLGSPHVVQTSAMTLTLSVAGGIYKSFKPSNSFSGWRTQRQIGKIQSCCSNGFSACCIFYAPCP